MLDGEATFGANRRRAVPPQIVLLGGGEELSVGEASPGTRFLLVAESASFFHAEGGKDAIAR